MGRVLVTGAFGRIGLESIPFLLAEGHEVVAFERYTPGTRKVAANVDPRVRTVWGDVLRPETLKAALPGVDAVVHMAGVTPPWSERDPENARRVNIEGTNCVIAAMTASRSARRLVFASSMAVYRKIQDREPPLSVEEPLEPSDAYGRHKVECEAAVRASGLHWTIARIGAVVPSSVEIWGEGPDPALAFEGSGDARVEPIAASDVGLAFGRVVDCSESIGRVLLLGGGEQCRVTVRELLNLMISGLGLAPVPPEAFRPATPPEFWGDWLDTEESQLMLHYQTHSMEDMRAKLRRNAGVLPYLIRLVPRVATWFLVRQSAYYADNLRSSREGAPSVR